MPEQTRLGLVTFAIGFVVEGATETFQFFANGYTATSWAGFYYFGLATTIAGFYLIYRGRTEWTDEHRRLVRHGHRAAGFSLAFFAAGTLAIAVVGGVSGTAAGAPFWIEALVGGAVAFAIGNFFLGLLLVVYRIVGPIGRSLGIGAFAWSLGIAGLTGWMVGQKFLTLLGEFVTNPLNLVAGFAPLAFTMAPLFVTYFLLTAAYWDAYRNLASPAGPRR